jgi:DNA-binding CsgD family transcriptional regulator
MAAPFVGRDRELKVMHAALDETAGRACGVLMTGEAGMGKTSLLRAFGEQVRSGGGTVLTSSCVPVGGQEMPFAPVVQALQSLRREHPVRFKVALEGSTGMVLGVLSPGLVDGMSGDGPGRPMGSPELLRSHLIMAVSDVLDRLAQGGPLIWVVDDLHWVDEPSLSVLGFLLRAQGGPRVLLALAARDQEMPAGVARWCAVEQAAQNLARHALPALSEEEIRELLSAVGPDQPRADAVREVAQLSGGNPFLVRELATTQSGGLPSSVLASTRASVDLLSHAARRVVAAVAAAGRVIPHVILAELLGDAAAEGAPAALRTGLIEVVGDGYQVRHELIRSALLEILLPAERLAAHRGLASVLGRRARASADPADLIEVARHADAADRPEEAVIWAERSAVAGERIAAFGAAHLALDRVLRVSDSTLRQMGLPDRASLAIRAATAADRVGDHEHARAHVAEALTLLDGSDPALRAVLLARLGTYLLYLGDAAAAMEAEREAVQLLPVTDLGSAARAEALWRISSVRSLTGRAREAQAAARESLAAARRVARPALIAQALAHLGAGTADPGGIDYLVAGLKLAEGAADAEAIAYAGLCLSDALLRLERFDESASFAHETLQELCRAGEAHHWLTSMIRTNACYALYATGAWPEAWSMMEQASVDDPFGFASLCRARLQLGHGDTQAADRALGEVTHLRRLDEPNYGLEYDETLTELRIWQGRPRDALANVHEVLGAIDVDTRDARGRLLCLLGVRAAADLAVSARAEHDETLLISLADDATQLLGAMETGHGYGEVARCAARAEVHRLRGDPRPDTWAEAASGWSQQPYPRAYALYRQSEASLAARRVRQESVKPLQEAAEICARLGARGLQTAIAGLAHRARLSLDCTPAAPSVAAKPAGLTDRELAVLRLLARGHTNREIGAQLYMSPKTASVHVTHVMQKLGVRSRVEAAAAASQLGLLRDAEDE